MIELHPLESVENSITTTFCLLKTYTQTAALVCVGKGKMRKFLIKTIIALVLITAGTLIRGEIVLGGEDCLAMALLIWGLVEEVQHVNSR